MNVSTKAIHIGQAPDPTTGAIIPPLYLTSTYVQEEPGKHKWYEYTRSGNPNFTNAEATLAALEDGKFALLYNSGLGANTTVILSLLEYGDKVLSIDDVYGWTYRLYSNVMNKFGINFEQHDLSNLDYVDEVFKASNTKMLRIESPTNPLLKTTNLEAVIQIAKKYDIITIVDNTFATPYFQQPLKLWADIVLHSTTKYLWGHSDIIWWATITNNKDIYQKLSYHRNAAGLNPNPFDARLLSRSLKTLAVRMKQHDTNAKILVEELTNHSLVKKLYYPWFGGMISVEFTLDIDQTIDFVSNLKLFRLAESLGGVESLIEHPASMTHASIPKATREAQGLSDGLIRISVGIENIDDLKNDLIGWLKKFL